MTNTTMLRRPLALALLALGLVATTPALAAGDAVAGKKSFVQCSLCHSVAPGAANGIGPNLAGIVGAKSGAKTGYAYSAAMKKANLTWNAKTLDAWIKKPSALVPGTKMMYGGMADAATRANVIAYMATLKAK